MQLIIHDNASVKKVWQWDYEANMIKQLKDQNARLETAYE